MQIIVDTLDVLAAVFADRDNHREFPAAQSDVKVPASGFDGVDGLGDADLPVGAIGVDAADVPDPPIVVHVIGSVDATDQVSLQHAKPFFVSSKAMIQLNRNAGLPGAVNAPLGLSFPQSSRSATRPNRRIRAVASAHSSAPADWRKVG